MTTPRVEIDGLEETARNMKALAKKYSQATAEAAVMAGQLVRSDAIKSIQTQSPGEIVTRSRAGGGEYEHMVSAEGAAPNTDTGRLVQSVQVEVTGKTVDVGSTLKYAGWLEFGTKRMAARPWLFPAFERNRAAIIQLFKKGTDTVTRKDGDV